MKGRAVLMSSARTGAKEKDDWRTPPAMVERLGEFFGAFTVDAAASPGNAIRGSTRAYTPFGRVSTTNPAIGLDAEDALSDHPWFRSPTFLNPPYSKMRRFMERTERAVREDGVPSVVALVAARTDTKAWQAVMRSASEVILVAGRVRFWKPDGSGPILDAKGKPVGAAFPSAVVLFTPRGGGPRFYSMTRSDLGG